MRTPVEMRLQRFLALAGVASRRQAEGLITAGKVTVNGQVASELGTKVDPDHDRVEIDGHRLLVERPTVILLNKPKGYVTTTADPEGRPTVMELVKLPGRVYPVGRLDYHTEGVLLLTNDGDLAFALMHPSHQVEKVYEAKVQGKVSLAELNTLRGGVTLDDGTRTAPTEVVHLGQTDQNSWIGVTLREGKNRQIHRMVEALGRQVLKLKRVAYAGLSLQGVKSGYWRRLSDEEVARLRELAGARTTQIRVHAQPPSRGRPGPTSPRRRSPGPPPGRGDRPASRDDHRSPRRQATRSAALDGGAQPSRAGDRPLKPARPHGRAPIPAPRRPPVPRRTASSPSSGRRRPSTSASSPR